MSEPGCVIQNIERVVAGKSEAVRLVVIGLLAEGHVLIEDLPGTGKTTLAQALARSFDASFRRVQCTSDMLPADILGVSVLDPATGTFRFQRGPIFGHVVVTDELNRATPRTQSALLEAMNEAQVSIDGTTHPLPRPFLVVATQNPIEVEGTYPLPESQLDRFLLRVALGYPSKDVERDILARHEHAPPLAALEPVATLADVVAWQTSVRSVRVEAPLIEYLLAIVEATRDPKTFLLGASTRAALGLRRAAQASAFLDGRAYCVPDDVKRLVVPVFAHRVLTRGTDETPIVASTERLNEILGRVPVPR
ncbi:MAG: MoxR family ATPase [Planctomycetes bacterium]|nr:MoxR family ATPase [Planctomycetota bacterium]MCC7172027.1 MoxR family ATPase [Planctomycetota bacterium]